jgi:hypothetical protein
VVITRTQRLWFWILFVADLLLVALLLLIIFSILMALAAMAAGIIAWPLFTCIGLILVVSCSGLFFTRRYPSTIPRRLGFATHGAALFLSLSILIFVGWSWFHSTRRRFLLPAGFQGDVYILHAKGGTPPEKSWWRTTYRVPEGGILSTSAPPLLAGQSYIDEYDYVGANGRLQKLSDLGPGTLQDTQENRHDNQRVYTYFPRSGSGGTADGCSYEDDEITIGTKAFILSAQRGTDINAFLAEHPEACEKRK